MKTTLENVLKTEKEILDASYTIHNNIIISTDVNVVGHFGNAPTLYIRASNVQVVFGYNNTANLGYLVRALFELLDVEEEDGKKLSEVTNVPVRLIFQGDGGFNSVCVGFGHYTKDRFVMTSDFMKIGHENA